MPSELNGIRDTAIAAHCDHSARSTEPHELLHDNFVRGGDHVEPR